MNYNTPHQFYCGVDLHARTMFTHVLDKKGKTVYGCFGPLEPSRTPLREPSRRCVRVGRFTRTGLKKQTAIRR